MVPDDSLTHPRARHRRLAAGLARAEPARHPGHAGLRRRHALARPAEEGPRLDPVHRRDADRAGVRRLHAGGNARGAARKMEPELHGHLHRRAQLRAAHLRHHAERADEEARVALHGRQRCARCATASGSSREALSVTFAGLDIGELSQLPLRRCRRAGAAAREAGWRSRAARRSSARSARGDASARAAGGAAHARRPTCGARPTCRRKSARRAAHRARPAGRVATLSSWAWATCRWIAARRRCRRASCSACGWPRSSARTCSAWSTCWTSRRPACIRPTARRCSPRWQRLKAAGNSLFVVEHDLAVMRRADWLVDVGPGAGERGGRVLYSGPPAGLAQVEASQTRPLPVRRGAARPRAAARGRAAGCGWRASRATTCAAWTSTFRWAASPR